MKTFVCSTQQDTEALGERIARAVSMPCFIALYGDLGAGKTVFVRGVARTLGIDDVTSPTFTIVHEYDASVPLYHFDAYRLNDGDALLDMGFDEYLRRDAFILLEWAELVEPALPFERLNVTITGSGDQARSITLDPVGERYERMVADL